SRRPAPERPVAREPIDAGAIGGEAIRLELATRDVGREARAVPHPHNPLPEARPEDAVRIGSEGPAILLAGGVLTDGRVRVGGAEGQSRSGRRVGDGDGGAGDGGGLEAIGERSMPWGDPAVGADEAHVVSAVRSLALRDLPEGDEPGTNRGEGRRASVEE